MNLEACKAESCGGVLSFRQLGLWSDCTATLLIDFGSGLISDVADNCLDRVYAHYEK